MSKSMHSTMPAVVAKQLRPIGLSIIPDDTSAREHENIRSNTEFYIGTPKGGSSPTGKALLTSLGKPARACPNVFDRLYGHGMSQKAARDSYSGAEKAVSSRQSSGRVTCSPLIAASREQILTKVPIISVAVMKSLLSPPVESSFVNISMEQSLLETSPLVKMETKNECSPKGILKKNSRSSSSCKSARLTYARPLTDGSKKRKVTFQIEMPSSRAPETPVGRTNVSCQTTSDTSMSLDEWSSVLSKLATNGESLDSANIHTDIPRSSLDVFYFLAKSFSKSSDKKWKINFDSIRNQLSILPFEGESQSHVHTCA